MKVYTKTGDKGMTSLVGGTRVSKIDSRLEAYGTIDETMAQIAFLRDSMDSENVNLTDFRDDLMIILRKLMTASAVVASEEGVLKSVPQIEQTDIDYLEKRIDYIQNELPKIDKFTIPGGHPLVSLSHICRTVTRRAERRVVAAAATNKLPVEVVTYLNRLSDYLYVLGRKLSDEYNVKEILWIPSEM